MEYISVKALIRGIFTVFAALAVVTIVAQLPELHRYMKIRSM